jgi:hypothetical protein
MKIMKRILRGILIGGLITVLVSIPVLAAYYAYIDVTESNGTSYTNLAMNVSLNCSYLAANGYITANGTDTRVTDSDYNVLPHMLADDRLLWVGNLTASSTSRFILYTGQSALDSFPVITGYGGYVTIPDDDALEPGGVFAFGVVGYVDTTTGSDKNIIRKDDAVKLYVSAAGAITFEVTGGNSLTASGVSSGFMTIMVYCDSYEMWMTINDVEQDRESASAIPATGNTWYLFENNVMPYVSYYGEWVVI